MRTVFLVLAILVLGLAAYVRLAPSDLARWHRMPLTDGTPETRPGDYPGTGAFTAVRYLAVDRFEALAELDRIARATDRTRVLAGSVEQGAVTYVTRSRVFGFPDYTSVFTTPGPDGGYDILTIRGRLRFGLDDMGVNRARVEGWLAKLPAEMFAP